MEVSLSKVKLKTFSNTHEPEGFGGCRMLPAVMVNHAAHAGVFDRAVGDHSRTGSPWAQRGEPSAHAHPPQQQPVPPAQTLQNTLRHQRVVDATNGVEDRQAPRTCRGWDVAVDGKRAGPPGPSRQDADRETRCPEKEEEEEDVDPDRPRPLCSDVGYLEHAYSPLYSYSEVRHDVGFPVQAYGPACTHNYSSTGARLGYPADDGYCGCAEQRCDYPTCPWGCATPWHGPRAWPDPRRWISRPHGRFTNDCCVPAASYSVNVPQFSTPPVEGVSQVSVMNLAPQDSPAGAAGGVSDPLERRRTVSLPDECRNIFVTYSEDAAPEMVPFAEFLSKQGFRPIIDKFDNPIRQMDIHKWMDSYLKDQSVLIVIAISPKYKADIESPRTDRHGLHTKYIYSMMQNEFIQQGSLNFRFVPVLFLSATQRHVPGWLQNTRVHRWPRDSEDLLLRLLREERYVAPPVPMELTLTIRPVAASPSAPGNRS